MGEPGCIRAFEADDAFRAEAGCSIDDKGATAVAARRILIDAEDVAGIGKDVGDAKGWDVGSCINSK